jgi:radical SAM protein with 4Fe4S-binding SPASM domain
MLSPRTAFRLARIFADYKRRAEVVRTPPIRLWVESSSVCNLRCPMCPNRAMAPADKRLMEFDLFRKITDEAREFASDIYLHHRGEPLLNPALFDMIRYARAAGLKTRFHTNGSLMDEAQAEKLLGARPDLVSISVDGFEQAAYEKIRVGARFETTVENIVRLARLRAARRLQRPYIVVEKIRFRKPDPPENPAPVAALTKRLLAAGVNEVIEKEEYTWTTEDAPEAAAPRQYAVCTFPWYAMVICADGTVTPCPQDFWAKMAMGNVNNSTLKEIWNGAAYRDLRRRFKTDINALPLCRKCDRLHRKTVGGVPFQYLVTFLVDQFVGYNRALRRLLGTSERNA